MTFIAGIIVGVVIGVVGMGAVVWAVVWAVACTVLRHCLQPGLFAPLDCADAVDHIPEAGAGPADETEEA